MTDSTHAIEYTLEDYADGMLKFKLRRPGGEWRQVSLQADIDPQALT